MVVKSAREKIIDALEEIKSEPTGLVSTHKDFIQAVLEGWLEMDGALRIALMVRPDRMPDLPIEQAHFYALEKLRYVK